MLGVLVLLVLIAAAVAAVVAVARRGRGRGGLPGIAHGRKPSRRHIVTRIICGVLGAGILVAVGIGTWADVRGAYALGEAAETLKLHLPTGPAPELPKLKDGQAEVELKDARFLIHFVFTEHGRPVHSDEMELRWPQDRGRTLVAQGQFRRVRYRMDLTPRTLSVARWGGSSRLSGQARYQLRLRGPMWNSGQSGGFSYEARRVLSRYRTRQMPNPLSVCPVPGTEGRLICLVHRAREDDPLRELKLKPYCAEVELPARKPQRHFGSGRRDRGVPPLVKLAGHVGISGLFLLAAAVLLAQLFARRGLGFAATLLGCVLFVAVLDRCALAAHASRAADAKLPAATRCLAVKLLGGTFFYRESAAKIAEELHGEAANPAELRRLSRFVSAQMRGAEGNEFLPARFVLDFPSAHAASAVRVEEKHSDDHGHFVLHVPPGAGEFSFAPQLGLETCDGRNSWSKGPYLRWTGSKLESPGTSTSSSRLSSGRFSQRVAVKQLTPTSLRIDYQVTFVPQRGDKRVTARHSITVEVRSEPGTP
jgi:hypothetical protein